MDEPTGQEIVSQRFDELDALTFHDIVRLRCDVFVVEQDCAYPELDGRDVDPGTLHHRVVERDTIAAYARSLTEPDGTVRIGRVVTAAEARGRGVAASLIGHLVETLPGTLVLDAQSYLVDWYERFGFAASGAEFVEDGIPHVPMRLDR